MKTGSGGLLTGIGQAAIVGLAFVYIIGVATRTSQLSDAGVPLSLGIPLIPTEDFLRAGIPTCTLAVVLLPVLLIVVMPLEWASRVTGFRLKWALKQKRAAKARRKAGRLRVAGGMLYIGFCILLWWAIFLLAEYPASAAATAAAFTLMASQQRARVRLPLATGVALLVFAVAAPWSQAPPLPEVSITQECGDTRGPLVSRDGAFWYVHAPGRSDGSKCPAGQVVAVNMSSASAVVMSSPDPNRTSTSIWNTMAKPW